MKKLLPIEALSKLNKGGVFKKSYKRIKKVTLEELSELTETGAVEYCPECDELLYFEDFCDRCGWWGSEEL
jgi:hypothetical protein